MNHNYYYHTSCTSAPARYVESMVDNAQKITWETFRKYVHWSEVKNVFPDYSYRGERGNCLDFHIKDDWAVRFYKSTYKNQPCYFIDHSSIEYIFLK